MGPVPRAFPPSAAEDALAYLRRRRAMLVRLARVERALARWDAWETNTLLPDDLRRSVPAPVLTREALDGLHRMLTEELARLDGRIDSGGEARGE
jgi:hypothetical protein